MHNIEYYTYDEKVNRRMVQEGLDEYVRREDWQEGASGLPRPILWVASPIYEDRDAAEAAIKAQDKRIDYNCMAVKYKEYPAPAPTKELTALREREAKQSEQIAKIRKEVSIQNRTSTYVTCPGCGSSLKRELVSNDRCPLCRTDLRSKTNLEWLKKAQAKLEEMQDERQRKEKEQSRKLKPTIAWLVKIEYHT